MSIKEFLDNVCNEIKYKPIRNEISEELKNHIEEAKEEYIENGLEEKDAEQKAIKQMGDAEQIGKKLNKIHRPKLDWKLLILIIILFGFGIAIAILKQSAMNKNHMASTIIYMAIGIVLSIGIYFLDYKKIKKYSYVIYFIATVLMILPITKYGIMINGTRFFKIFGTTINPSTISMPLYIISFAGLLIDFDRNRKIDFNYLFEDISIRKDYIKILFFGGLSLVLMLYLTSINAYILFITYLILITIKIVQSKENRIKKLMALYIPLIIISILMFEFIINHPYNIKRIIYSFYPEKDPQGWGYVGMLQKEVLENAKIIGEADTKIISSDKYLLSKDSNYNFIYLLGKMGFLAAGILVLTIILISIKLIINAKSIKDDYGKYIIIGLSTVYIIESFASILMNVNLGILANVDIPFVTYGGVYFIVNILSIALIFSIYRRKDINIIK